MSTLPQLPRLKPTLRLVADGDALRLRTAEREFVIDRPPSWARPLLDALDGKHEIAEISDELRAAGFQVPLAEANETVAQLSTLGLLDDAVHDRLISGAERDRYDRQLRYFADTVRAGESSAHRQLRLRDARVTVLGVGALGGHVALTLAGAGIGTLAAVDGDVVELSNLNRQTLYGEDDVGRPKVEVAAERIAALNSAVKLATDRRWLECPADVEKAIAEADFVIDAVDSPPGEIERWVNAACFSLGIPYIAMSQIPPWIRVGPTYLPGETGCYHCQELAWRVQDPLFDVAFDSTQVAATGPTALAVAGLVAMEAIHHLTGIARPATLGAAVLIDVRTLSCERRPVVRRPECSVCGPLAA